MGDPWARAAVLIGVAVLALTLVALLRRRSARRPEHELPATGLPAGIYLLTSAGCATCEDARHRLAAAGVGEYTELSWESRPDVFTRLDVDAVPSLLVVSSSGMGTIHPGAPSSVIAGL